MQIIIRSVQMYISSNKWQSQSPRDCILEDMLMNETDKWNVGVDGDDGVRSTVNAYV